MDWGTLNALGITLMAVFAIWLLYREHGLLEKRRRPEKDPHK